MIIVVASVLAILTVPLTGVSLRPLAKLPIYRVWLIWTSIALQMGITMVPGFPNWLGQPVHVFTFVVAVVFMWSNRHICGSLLIALGAGLNMAAIVANGGTMPASAWAWHTAGFPARTAAFENSNVVSSARLWWLGDIFAIPAGWPLSNVFSIGDVVVIIAITYFAHMSCRRPPAYLRTAAAPQRPAMAAMQWPAPSPLAR